MFLILLIAGAQYDKTSLGWKALCRVACLCSRAEFKMNQQSMPILKREVNGEFIHTRNNIWKVCCVVS